MNAPETQVKEIANASAPHGVGARRPLVDGVEKVTGTARYTADLPADNALVGLMLRSPYACAVGMPSSFFMTANSTIRIAFFAANPIRVTMPIWK